MKVTNGTWLTRAEATVYANYRSPDMIYRNVRNGKIKTKKIGNKSYYLQTDLDKLIKLRARFKNSEQSQLRGKQTCFSCEKVLSSRQSTYFKGHTLCRDCLNADLKTPTIETYTVMQSSMSMIDTQDEHAIKNHRAKAFYYKEKSDAA